MTWAFDLVLLFSGLLNLICIFAFTKVKFKGYSDIDKTRLAIVSRRRFELGWHTSRGFRLRGDNVTFPMLRIVY